MPLSWIKSPKKDEHGEDQQAKCNRNLETNKQIWIQLNETTICTCGWYQPPKNVNLVKQKIVSELWISHDISILPSLHKNRQRHLAKIAKRRNWVMTQHRDFRVLTGCTLGGLQWLFGPQSQHSSWNSSLSRHVPNMFFMFDSRT